MQLLRCWQEIQVVKFPLSVTQFNPQCCHGSFSFPFSFFQNQKGAEPLIKIKWPSQDKLCTTFGGSCKPLLSPSLPKSRQCRQRLYQQHQPPAQISMHAIKFKTHACYANEPSRLPPNLLSNRGIQGFWKTNFAQVAQSLQSPTLPSCNPEQKALDPKEGSSLKHPISSLLFSNCFLQRTSFFTLTPDFR